MDYTLALNLKKAGFPQCSDGYYLDKNDKKDKDYYSDNQAYVPTFKY